MALTGFVGVVRFGEVAVNTRLASALRASCVQRRSGSRPVPPLPPYVLDRQVLVMILRHRNAQSMARHTGRIATGELLERLYVGRGAHTEIEIVNARSEMGFHPPQ